MSEIKQALEAAREIVDACAGDNLPAAGWASEVREQIDATLSSAAVTEREPVATVAEVFVDGKRLYNITYPADALDKLPKGAALYLDPPPTSELEAENARLREERDEHKRLKNELVLKAYPAMDGADDLIEALGRYGFPVSDAAEPALMEGGSREAHALHKAAKAFIAARRVCEGGKVDG